MNPPIASNTPSTSYKPNIMVVGASGSGKSTSIESLPQDETTAIIETECKGLPFKNNFPKVSFVETREEFEAALAKYKADPVVRVIVIDSISKHLERCLNFCRSTQKNYDIWTMYGRMGSALMASLHSKEKIIIAVSLDELVELESNETGVVTKTFRKMAATFMGKELQGKLDKEFTIVLHTVMKKNAQGLIEHFFLAKPDGLTTAKTPRAMFQGKLLVANDLNLVVKETEAKLL